MKIKVLRSLGQISSAREVLGIVAEERHGHGWHGKGSFGTCEKPSCKQARAALEQINDAIASLGEEAAQASYRAQRRAQQECAKVAESRGTPEGDAIAQAIRALYESKHDPLAPIPGLDSGF